MHFRGRELATLDSQAVARRATLFRDQHSTRMRSRVWWMLA